MTSSGSLATIPALTSIRAFAAMGIVLLHFGLVTGVNVLPSSWVLTQSLSVFFVLSGFILALRYPELPTRRATARYLIARVARIWPLHLFTLGVIALLSPIPYQVSVGAPVLLLNAFLLQAWVPIYSVYASFNSPSFSLSIELFLYSSFPLLIRGRRWTWIIKIGLPLLIATGMIVIADRLLTASSEVDAAGLVYNHPLSRLWEFAVGVGAASVWRRLRGRVRLSRWGATTAEVSVAALVVANVATASRVVDAVGGGLGRGARLWLSNAGLAAVPIAALLVLLALERGLLGRALSWPPLVLLGDISYSTYLLHGILLLPVFFRWDVFRNLTNTQLAASFCASVLVASYLSWALIEVPARAFVLHVSDRTIGLWKRDGSPGASRQGQWRVRATWKGLATCAVVLVAITLLVFSTGRSGSALERLPQLDGRAAGGIESVGGAKVRDSAATIGPERERVEVSGWAVDSVSRSDVRGILLTIDDRRPTWLRSGLERRDVAARFGNRHRFSGFAGTVVIGDLGPGSHRLEARAVLFRPEGYLMLSPVRLNLR